MAFGFNLNTKFTIKNRPQVEREIVREAAKILEAALDAVKPEIKDRVFKLVHERIVASPEYSAMQPGGTLYGQLGVVNINEAVAQIIRRIADSTDIVSNVKPAGKFLSGQLQISILKDDYSDLISLPLSKFVSENGHSVEWLKYLLLDGTQVIFHNYYFVAFGRNGKVFDVSRTKEGIMRNTGGSHRPRWRVPAEYAGVAEDNWLTRALSDLPKLVTAVISKDLQKRLGG